MLYPIELRVLARMNRGGIKARICPRRNFFVGRNLHYPARALLPIGLARGGVGAGRGRGAARRLPLVFAGLRIVDAALGAGDVVSGAVAGVIGARGSQAEQRDGKNEANGGTQFHGEEGSCKIAPVRAFGRMRRGRPAIVH